MRKIIVSKVPVCLFFVMSLTLFSCATTHPLSPVIMRERNPRLSASYKMNYGKENTEISINTQIKVLETYSSKAYEAIKRGDKNIDLRSLSPNELSSSPYYITVGGIKGSDMTVNTDKGPIRDGLKGVLSTQKKIYVMLDIPKEYGIICRGNTQEDKQPADSSTKMEMIDDTFARVWGNLFFGVDISADSYELMKGLLIPVLSVKERNEIILMSLTGK